MVGPFSEISFAQPDDEDAIFAMLLALHAENGIFQVSELRVRSLIRQATGQQLGMIGIIQGPSGLEASIGMAMEQFWYTDEWYLGERWNFVYPEYRRSTHAVRLIEFAKWCSEQMHVPLLMGIMSTHQTEAKVRMYRRHMMQVGGLFMHNLPEGIVVTQENGEDKSKPAAGPVLSLRSIN